MIIIKISHEKTWIGLRKGNLMRETEYLPTAAQNNPIRTNYVEARIDKAQKIPVVDYVLIERRIDQLHNNRMP